jgi:hypothetical protein
LPPIIERRRRSERQLWRDFEDARPRILGSLLDAAVHGLRKLPSLHLEQLPRMADFALWATACETAFWPAGTSHGRIRQTAGPRSKSSLTPIQ